VSASARVRSSVARRAAVDHCAALRRPCWSSGVSRTAAHTSVCDTTVCMAQVDRLSVTMPPEIGATVREAATRQGTSVSNWLVAAAAQRLRNELLGAALDRWEEEEGPFSDEELDAAAAALSTTRRRGVA
jgi:hypothetical protein